MLSCGLNLLKVALHDANVRLTHKAAMFFRIVPIGVSPFSTAMIQVYLKSTRKPTVDVPNSALGFDRTAVAFLRRNAQGGWR